MKNQYFESDHYESLSDPDLMIKNIIHVDEKYVNRKLEISQIISKQDNIIQNINYTKCEHNTWKICFNKLLPLFDNYACDEFRYGLDTLISNKIYNINEIPQLGPINKFFEERTGWQIKPVVNLLSTKDFISGFQHKIFYTTQHIRHHSQPFYTSEPDIISGLVGYVPLLLDTNISDFLQNLGHVSAIASDGLMEKISKIYHYIMEYGLCKTDYGIKIHGGCILSNANEIEYCMNPQNIGLIKELKEFNFDASNKLNELNELNKYICINNVSQVIKSIKQYINDQIEINVVE